MNPAPLSYDQSIQLALFASEPAIQTVQWVEHDETKSCEYVITSAPE
ncbi:MAG: hypothetical protein SPK06_08860 [Kiritimatiellia bacterium]|nr:hypothetical protein [Kiritimatiellia bacterium]